MDKQTFYLVKANHHQVIGKQTEGHRFLFKGSLVGRISDFRTWMESIKNYQDQGYSLRSDLDMDEPVPLKVILDTILENAGKKIHAVAQTKVGWEDRLGNTFTDIPFK
jgi:hypothetical protein